MDKQTIEEYDLKEKDQTNLLMKRAEQKLNEGGRLSVADFFPSFEGTSFSNYVVDELLPLQLPFSTGLIVSVEPFLTKELFANQYGITADQMYELILDGVISPVINCGLWRYVDVNYLDDILELKPPTYNRLTGFFTVLSKNKYLEYFCEGESSFRNKLSEVAKREKWDLYYPCGKEAYETKASYDYARIKCLYPHLLRNIDLASPIKASDLILYYDEIFVDAFTHAYEGIHKISFKKLKFQIPGANRSEVFHNDLARILVSNFKLEYPRDLDIDVLKEVMKDPVVRKAKQTLVELDKSVQKEQQEKVCERAVALKNIWRETCDAMDSMNTQKSAIEKTIASVGVASIGVGTYMGTRSIVDSMSLGALAYSPLTSTSRVISNEIVKLKKPNHISVCWDYSTKIRRIKKAKGLIA